ncbi:hypothetical protein A3D03_05705 [Candidatus Gottesmanbacteria bacterium RIFCSPHIGHO2_02_FULL_40_13]|uniref:Uncharacterized protein n=1 Tax=Candidatus Gottesmanbacteria bacterium RIFCSPHIGHO2_02_FULL_40_13 TaxID=1798384 RepID=A0A1F6A959_9BACT|nr:MAG: hypothetical protein A3D03_05705 [Candidatus Gottesmanbacteria bacterium RIFCSPHIGHO2_02_FULL_40_13]
MKEKFLKGNNIHQWILAATIIVVVFIALSVTQKSKYLSSGFLKNPGTTLDISPTVTVQITLPQALTKSDYIDKAVENLAVKLSVDKSQITVERSEEYLWNDASLGCPQKGMFYAQIIIPGFTIDLSHSGTIYSYHAGSNRVVSCQN